MLINFLCGCSARDWRFAAKKFMKAFPNDVIVHCELNFCICICFLFSFLSICLALFWFDDYEMKCPNLIHGLAFAYFTFRNN